MKNIFQYRSFACSHTIPDAAPELLLHLKNPQSICDLTMYGFVFHRNKQCSFIVFYLLSSFIKLHITTHSDQTQTHTMINKTKRTQVKPALSTTKLEYHMFTTTAKSHSPQTSKDIPVQTSTKLRTQLPRVSLDGSISSLWTSVYRFTLRLHEMTCHHLYHHLKPQLHPHLTDAPPRDSVH